MSTIKRPYPRTAPCGVMCRGDGNQVCALIGENIHDGAAGFGDTLPEALRCLADELEREVGEEPTAELAALRKDRERLMEALRRAIPHIPGNAVDAKMVLTHPVDECRTLEFCEKALALTPASGDKEVKS